MVIMLCYILKKMFAFVKHKGPELYWIAQPIKMITKDMVSAHQQNSLLLFLFRNRCNEIIDNSVSKNLNVESTIIIEEKPKLELKEISVVKKEGKARRIL